MKRRESEHAMLEFGKDHNDAAAASSEAPFAFASWIGTNTYCHSTYIHIDMHNKI